MLTSMFMTHLMHNNVFKYLLLFFQDHIYRLYLCQIQKAVEISEKIYGGCSATQTAMAHEALAKALVVSLNFTDENYYVHTQKAWSIAKDVIPAQHPKLAPFKYTLGNIVFYCLILFARL